MPEVKVRYKTAHALFGKLACVTSIESTQLISKPIILESFKMKSHKISFRPAEHLKE